MSVAGPQNQFLTLSFCSPSPLSEQGPTRTGVWGGAAHTHGSPTYQTYPVQCGLRGKLGGRSSLPLFPCSDLVLFAFSRRGRLSKQWMLGLCCAPARTVAGGLRSQTPSMRLLFPALVLALLATSHAAEGEL